MALPDKLKPTALTSLTTGISNQTIANGASFTGSEIDNTSNRYSLMAVEVEWSYSTAPTANKTVELQIKEALDGTNYEDTARTIAAFSPSADTTSHRLVLLSEYPLVADKFKLVLKNTDTGQTITATVRAWGYDMAVED